MWAQLFATVIGLALGWTLVLVVLLYLLNFPPFVEVIRALLLTIGLS